MSDKRQEIFLVLRAQSGDKTALDELFALVQEPLYRYIVSLVGDATLAEDVLQEVFVRIYRKLYWLREPEVFRAWAYRIASREAFRWLKRERRWREQIRDEEILAETPAPEKFEPRKFEPEILANLPQLLTKISPASRAVIALHYIHELSLEETAKILEINLGTAKSRLAYGLNSLRKLLREKREKL